MTKVTIKVDDENNAEEFWAGLRKQFPNIAQALEAHETCHVTRVEWMKIQAIPGFLCGPRYAPGALFEV
jgi:hypothetical protein